MKLKTKTTEKTEWNKRKSHDKYLARLKKKDKKYLASIRLHRHWKDSKQIPCTILCMLSWQIELGLFLKKTTKIHPTWDRQPE